MEHNDADMYLSEDAKTHLFVNTQKANGATTTTTITTSLHQCERKTGAERMEYLLEWRRLNTQRYGYRSAYRAATEVKEALPPEFLRKVVKDNGDLSGKRFKSERKLCVGMLQYVPLALYKLVENIPMPWEETRYVDVVYHVNGVLTIVNDTPTVARPVYAAQWGSMWTLMRSMKLELALQGSGFRRVMHKGNENEPPLDYTDYLIDRDPPPALRDDLTDENDNLDNHQNDDDNDENLAMTVTNNGGMGSWLYDPFPRLMHKNQIRGPRCPRGYYFSIDVMEPLFRLATPILPELTDRNYYYVWELRSFYTAKAMHLAIPRGPKFEPPPAFHSANNKGSSLSYHHHSNSGSGGYQDEDWTEFNDLRRVIHRDDARRPRFTMLTERTIAFPYLYGSIVDGVKSAEYVHSPQVNVANDDPLLSCFTYHSSLNPIKAITRLFDESMLSKTELISHHVRGVMEGSNNNNNNNNKKNMFYNYYYEEEEQEEEEEYESEQLHQSNKTSTNKKKKRKSHKNKNSIALPVIPELQPFLNDAPLEDENTKSAFSLLFAPAPFNAFTGGLTRRVDVPLADNFYQYPPELQGADPREKILRSYTQLLKHHVKRSLEGEHRRQRRYAQCRQRRWQKWKREQQELERREREQQRVLVSTSSNSNNSLSRANGTQHVLNGNEEEGASRCQNREENTINNDNEEEDEDVNENEEEERAEVQRRLDKLASIEYFATTKIDWLEAALQLMRQGHNMLVQLINMKCLPYVHIDYNFEAKPTRTLTTKEIKKSRLGPAFHMIREMLGFVKRLVDLHVMYRLGRMNALQLADATHYLFTHIGVLTGIYRYKLRAMRQIKRTRDWKHLLYSRFNVGGVPAGPGCGFWGPSWRVWVFFMRGMTPLLQRYLSNLTDRVLRGRVQKGKYEGKRITRQRVETDKDVNIKEAFRRELREMLPDNVKPSVIVTMDQHLNEAFRHWRAGLTWSIAGLPNALEALVQKYVKLRSEEYIRITQLQRKRIAEGDTVDKQAFMKNLGRLTRLKIMSEQQRQQMYLGGKDAHTQLASEDATEMYRMMANWLNERGFKKIEFPDPAKTAELSLLQLSLNRLRDQHNIANRLTASQREEQARIEEAFNAPHEALSRIVDAIARQRRFKNVEVEYMDDFSHLYPIYNVVPSEKMVDAFVDQYLWYKAMNVQRLFPSWVKPADAELAPQMVYKWCNGINNSPDIWNVEKEESVVLMHCNLQDAFYDNVDWNVFRHLLELIMDKSLVEYIVSRHDVMVEFKDMSYHHHKGILRGFMFSSFLLQYWGLLIDVLFLGSKRSEEIAGSATRPNPFMSFIRDPYLANSHPIRGYCRYRNEVYILLRYTKVEADAVRRRYLEETNHDPELRAKNGSVYNFKNFALWPRDARMRLFLMDVNLARAVLWEFSGRLPPGVGVMNEDNCALSVYSKDNPNLLFDMAGFAIRLLPVARTEDNVLESESMWSLRSSVTRDITCRAFLQVAADHVEMIRNKARRTIMMVGSATFHSIAAKWNALVTEIVPYYREAILGSESLQALLARAEHRMQARVMMALNSRAKSRFPPAMFYAPSDFGGLGMLSVGHSLIPARDTVYSRTTTTGVQYFYSGLTNSEDIPIPNILQYYAPWETEYNESERAWAEYRSREREAKASGGRVSLDDVEDIIDKGLPRIRVRFSRHAPLFHFDSGFRARMEFQKYQAGKYLKNWWFHIEHDGNVCGGVLERYRTDVNIALGGVEAILEHSLFKGTGFPSWEGIEFNRGGGFENSKKDVKLAKQQRAGLTKVPNQRFALWWSPTINRSDVQAGFESKIETTGVFMCGKLETIKKSLIKIFSGSLWEKCHGAVVNDVASKLKDSLEQLGASNVTLQQQHPQKSYTFTSSAADIILLGASRWQVTSKPTSLADEGNHSDIYAHNSSSRYWIDVQLRWGNYDSHNIAEYARTKFYEYSTAKMYSFPAGIIIAIDLAYNCYSAFGYWIPQMKSFVRTLMPIIMKNNITLNTLRDRMKRDLGLFSSAPTEASLTDTNLAELFSSDMRTWIVDDSATFVTSEQPTPDGGKKFKSENGAVLIFEPISGDVKMSVVHKSVFAGQKRRGKLAREKAAEEIASWLRTTPANERPGKIIVTRSRFRQTLHNMLVLDHPNIIIGQTDLNLPIPMMLRHSRLVEWRISATESKGWEFTIYDDWQQTLQFQPITCFNLLNLILRGYHVNVTRTRQILVPDLHVEVAPTHFWPTYLTREEWERVSIQLQQMIIADAARRMNVSPNDFTEKEKEGILLGKKMTNVEVQEEEIKEIEAMRRTKLSETAIVNVTTAEGNVVTRKVKAAFDFGSGVLETNWRVRAMANASLLNDSTRVIIDTYHTTTGSSDQLIVPQEMLQMFLSCCDVKVQCGAILLGHALPDAPYIKEVLCLLLPPQTGTANTIRMPSHIPFTSHHITDNNLSFLGYIRVGDTDLQLTSHDVALIGKLVGANTSNNNNNEEGSMRVDGLMCVIAALSQNEVTLRAYSLTPDGLSWARHEANNALKKTSTEAASEMYTFSRATISTTTHGFFLVPMERTWNYFFIGAQWNEESEYDVTVDVPLPFFHPLHRVEHFVNFLRLGENEELVDVNDNNDVFEDEDALQTS